MSKFGEFDIKQEQSDEKGMINAIAFEDFISKAKKAVCEISLSNRFGSGFFCKIPYTQNNNLLLPVLITNHHVLSKDILNNSNDIKIKINGKTKVISLKKRKKGQMKKMNNDNNQQMINYALNEIYESFVPNNNTFPNSNQCQMNNFNQNQITNKIFNQNQNQMNDYNQNQINNQNKMNND